MPKPQLSLSFGHLLLSFSRSDRSLLLHILDESSLIFLPDMLKLIFLQFIERVELTLIFVQIIVSVSIVVFSKIFIDLLDERS